MYLVQIILEEMLQILLTRFSLIFSIEENSL